MPDITVFLDRDGVINVRAPEHVYITRFEDFHFLPKVTEAIAALTSAGVRIIIVTNQRGIATRKVSADSVLDIHTRMCAELEKSGGRIEKVYVCPHNIGECTCRKPGTGMFEQAERDFGICRSESWTVGDSPSDIEAGKRFGTKTIFIGDVCEGADYTCPDLFAAAKIILENSSEE